MSVPAEDSWFSCSIRRNRKSFFVANIYLIGILAALVAAVYFFQIRGAAALLFCIAFGLPWVFVSYNLTAQRLRDLNVTGWLSLLWIPVNMMYNEYFVLSSALSTAFWVVLLFVPGTEGDNRYGSDPLVD